MGKPSKKEEKPRSTNREKKLIKPAPMKSQKDKL